LLRLPLLLRSPRFLSVSLPRDADRLRPRLVSAQTGCVMSLRRSAHHQTHLPSSSLPQHAD
jgi:hypothetical protein